jgi:hypothetical protein
VRCDQTITKLKLNIRWKACDDILEASLETTKMACVEESIGHFVVDIRTVTAFYDHII